MLRYVYGFFGLVAAIGSATGPATGEVTGRPAMAGISDNPAADAIRDNQADCPDPRLSIGSGFARQLDIDGDGLNDVVLDFIGLLCDGVPSYCGTGGCLHEIWLADHNGPYRRLLTDLMVEIEYPSPGRLRIVMGGSECGLSGAEICKYEYRIEGDHLVAVVDDEP